MDGRLGSGMAQPRWLDQVKIPEALRAQVHGSPTLHFSSLPGGSLSEGRRDGMMPVYYVEGRKKKSIMDLVIGGAGLFPNYTKRTVRGISLGRHVTPGCPPPSRL